MRLNIWSSLSIVVIVLLIITSWYLFQTNTNLKNNNDLFTRQKADLEKQLTDEVAYKQSLEKDLAEIKGQREALQSKVGNLSIQIQDISSEFNGKIKNYEQELAALRDDQIKKEEALANKNKELVNLNNVIKSHEHMIEELKSRLAANLEKAAEAQAEQGKGTVTLSPITVKTKESTPVEAKVLEANREYGFVVISAGNREGLRSGDTLFVFRKDQLLGKVVVEKVGENVSVAKILYKTLENVVKKGDLVRN